MDRYFVAGVIIGLIIGAIWRNLQPKNSPDKDDQVMEWRQPMRKAAGQ